MRIFLTHVVPKHKILDYHVSAAACNFCYNLMSGKMFDKVYSILPPYVRPDKNELHQDGIDFIFSSWRKGNKIMRRLAPLIENWMLYKQIPKDASIWLYNLTVLSAPLVILLSLFKPSLRIYIIVLDFTPEAKYNNLFLWMINRCHGRICLAYSDLFSQENTLCLPGVVPIQLTNHEEIHHINMDFLLSGVLSENISMLSMVLQAFKQTPHLRLHITGKALNKELLNQYTSCCSNIHYYGVLPYEEYVCLLQRVSFQLSTRNPVSLENQFNFPSKIIEALLYNRIIVSTLEYKQLNGINYIKIGSSLEDFKEGLLHIASLSERELLWYANQGSLAWQRFNPNVWESCMQKIEM